MDRIISFSQKRNENKKVIERHEERVALNEALREFKESTGIDFMKVIRGDSKEKHRLNMRRYQDSMKDPY